MTMINPTITKMIHKCSKSPRATANWRKATTGPNKCRKQRKRCPFPSKGQPSPSKKGASPRRNCQWHQRPRSLRRRRWHVTARKQNVWNCIVIASDWIKHVMGATVWDATICPSSRRKETIPCSLSWRGILKLLGLKLMRNSMLRGAIAKNRDARKSIVSATRLG